MPVIIAAVSQYKNNPDSIYNLMKTPKQSASNEGQNSSQLDRIEQKLDQLLTLLAPK